MCIISQSESTKSSHSFEEPFLPNTFWYNLLRVVAMPSFECAVSVAMSLGCTLTFTSKHTRNS